MMQPIQWMMGNAIPDGMSPYLVLMTGTNVYAHDSPDARGPISLGVWLARTATEAVEAAGPAAAPYNHTIVNPALVAVPVHGLAQ